MEQPLRLQTQLHSSQLKSFLNIYNYLIHVLYFSFRNISETKNRPRKFLLCHLKYDSGFLVLTLWERWHLSPWKRESSTSTRSIQAPLSRSTFSTNFIRTTRLDTKTSKFSSEIFTSTAITIWKSWQSIFDKMFSGSRMLVMRSSRLTSLSSMLRTRSIERGHCPINLSKFKSAEVRTKDLQSWVVSRWRQESSHTLVATNILIDGIPSSFYAW